MMRKRHVALLAGVAAALLAGAGTAQAAPDAAPDKVWQADLRQELRAADTGPTQFTPVAPVRVLDTRTGTGTGGSKNPVGSGAEITLDLSAHVPETAAAVVLNVTGTQPTAGTFITVYPAGVARPVVSNQNLVPGQTRPNAVTVELGTNRQLKLYNNFGSTHLIADLTGYYGTAEGNLYTPQQPVRLLDTRNPGKGPVGPTGVVSVDFSSLPATASAVTFNLTGTGATAHTFVAAYPGGTDRPIVSNLNLAPGETAPNQVTVALGADRKVDLYNNFGNTHLIVDLVGFYATDQGFPFWAATPFRVFDTRDVPGSGLFGGETGALCGVDPEIVALVGNMTGTNTQGFTFLTMWPGDQARPLASQLNLVPGQTAPNQITVPLGPSTFPDCEGNSFHIFNNNGYVDLIFDIAGFFAPVPAQ